MRGVRGEETEQGRGEVSQPDPRHAARRGFPRDRTPEIDPGLAEREAADETRYRPFDQEEKLGPAPWSPDDPALIAWEKAHGHDVRLKCYPELGCVLVEVELERERDDAHTALLELEAERNEARTALAELAAEVRRALRFSRPRGAHAGVVYIVQRGGLKTFELPRIDAILREPADSDPA
jgi:hypothetical protein